MKNTILLFIICLGLPFSLQAQSRTDSLLITIGFRIDATLANGDPSYMNQIFDKNYLLDEILLDQPGLEEFNAGFSQARFVEEISKAIIKEIKEKDASYDFINYSEDLTGYHLMFRLFSESGTNYHRYFLYENDEGDLVIGNVFIVLRGENLSEIVKRSYLKNALGLPEEKATEIKRNTFLYNIANNHIENGKLSTARTVYSTLSDKIHNQMDFLLLELQTMEDTTQLNQWIGRFEDAYPQNPAPYLLSIDPFLEMDAPDRCLDMINSLDVFVEDDFLDYFRANIYYTMGDMDNSLIYYKKLYANYPQFLDGVSDYLHVCIEMKEFEQGVEILDNLIENLGYTKKQVKSFLRVDYPDFYNSEEVKAWTKK